MTTLEKIKLTLRIRHGKLDEDIQSDINACLTDLEVHGVTGSNAVENDPLIQNAIKLWCKSLYTDDTTKAAEWLRRYESLRACLMVAEGYGWEAATDE